MRMTDEIEDNVTWLEVTCKGASSDYQKPNENIIL